MKFATPETKQFIDENEISKPLNPPEAFFGYRVNATKSYHKAKWSKRLVLKERINYIDVCSLYPWSNKHGIYLIVTNQQYKQTLLCNNYMHGIVTT